MKVPLIAYTGNNCFRIYRNGKCENVRFPFLPYFYSTEPLEIEECLIKREKKTFLSTNQEGWVYKHSFDTMEEYWNAMRDYLQSVIYSESFMHSTLIDAPDFFYDYALEKPLKILAIDIEVKTNGSSTFPKPETHQIYSIGVKAYEGLWNEVYSNVFECYHGKEIDMLNTFMKFYRAFDPDVVMGYNIKRFDIPFIVKRLEKCGISSAYLQRNTQNPVDLSPLQQSMFRQNKTVYDTKIRLYGRVVCDVYVLVQRDNKLRKLRDYKLQTIADWFGFPAKTLDRGIVANLEKFVESGHEDQLNDYVLHDCELTKLVANVYFPGKIYLAEIIGCPLDLVINDYPTFVPSLIHARPLRKLNYIADKKNADRYAMMTYEGAYVGLNKAGLYKPVYHVDFSSMYPSIIRTFNLSPETTWLEGVEPMGNELEFVNRENDWLVKIPDNKYGGNVVIGIRKTIGILPEQLTYMYNKRLEFKNKYRETRDEKDNSLQNIYKLILNVSYGYNGSSYARWGNLPVAIATTGIGRFLVKKVCSWLGSGLIEADTDGCYVSNPVDVKDLTIRLNDWIKGFGFTNSCMELDFDKHDGGYFYKAKNYVILDKGKLAWTGNSFISRRQPRLAQKALEKLVLCKLNGDDAKKVISELYDFKKYTIHDYTQNCRLWHDVDDYKQENALARRLALQAQKHFGEDISIRTQFSYVVTRDRREPYKLSDLVSVDQINYKYYEKELDKLIDRVGFSKYESLEKWMQ